MERKSYYVILGVSPTEGKRGIRAAYCELARKLHEDLKAAAIPSFYDESGSIGRRYRRQDEAGTPWCVTVDGQTVEDQTVTIRDRDTLEQVRVSVDAVKHAIRPKEADLFFKTRIQPKE